jgi:hypothetical protein
VLAYACVKMVWSAQRRTVLTALLGCSLQGANGLVRSTGDGYWLFDDVLFTYTGKSQATKRGVPVLAVALPVVFGVLLLVGACVLAWLWTRKRARCVEAATEL